MKRASWIKNRMIQFFKGNLIFKESQHNECENPISICISNLSGIKIGIREKRQMLRILECTEFMCPQIDRQRMPTG